MVTIVIESIHDIEVDEYAGNTTLYFKELSGSITKIEMGRVDAKLLMERLQEKYQKEGA